MFLRKLSSDFLNYLIDEQVQPGDSLPTLRELGSALGVSVGKLREELEVARSLGLVSVRPRVGVQREPFDFSQSVLPAVLFALGTGEAEFAQFSQLRRAIETSFWHDAVTLLTPADKEHLVEIVGSAWSRLRVEPIHVPNGEHRQFHLTIFRRLENPFVQGLLAAYWDAYEASELTRFASYQYWLDVWSYHERIADALVQDDFEAGRQLLIEHFSLLRMATSPTDIEGVVK